MSTASAPLLLLCCILSAACSQAPQQHSPVPTLQDPLLAPGPTHDPLERPMVQVDMELISGQRGPAQLQVLSAPRVTVLEGGSASVSILNQRAYVSRFEVEIAGDAAIADPVVEVFEEGYVFEITPHRFREGHWGAALAVSESVIEDLPAFGVRLGTTEVQIQIPEAATHTWHTALRPSADALWVLDLGAGPDGEQRLLRIRMRELSPAELDQAG